jgi:hypothetical protein
MNARIGKRLTAKRLVPQSVARDKRGYCNAYRFGRI